MKKRMPLILSIILLVVAMLVTVMFDRLVDRDRLAEVATIPDYTRPVNESENTTEETQPEGRKDYAHPELRPVWYRPYMKRSAQL